MVTRTFLQTITLHFILYSMDYHQLTTLKQTFDSYKPLHPRLLHNLEHWFNVELTYTSNALEGNTLTRQETSIILEKGLTVGGKSLREHLEATNHAQALAFIHTLVQGGLQQITEAHLLALHSHILKGIDDDYAGRYRDLPVRIAGSTVILPNPRKVPSLMEEFIEWLSEDQPLHPVHLAAEAHYRLVTIHPFIDGNGRTARLLMNLILLMHGYPPAIIQVKDRHLYLSSLEKAQTGGSKKNYETLIFKAVRKSLNLYIKAAQGDYDYEQDQPKSLLKIGELSKATKLSVATLRFWTKEGLLQATEITEAGYHLYHPDMIERCTKIQSLKEQRFTLQEIRENLLLY